MSWISNLKIGKKLGLGFGVVLATTLVLGCLSIIQLSRLNASVEDLGTNWLPSVRALGDLRFDTSAVRRQELNVLINPDKAAAEAVLNRRIGQVVADEKKYQAMIDSADEKRLEKDFQAAWDKYLAELKGVLELVRQNKAAAAQSHALKEGKVTFEAADALLTQDVELNDKGAADARKTGDDVYSSSRYWVFALLGGAIVIGLSTSISMAKSLSSGISKMLAVIQEIAANNLAVDDLEITSRDEIGQAGLALNKMKNNLSEIVESISATAEHVASASEELSSSATLQAQGAETQSNQTTQVATAMQEMSSTVLQVSENSSKAAEASRQAAETAREGGTIVEDTLGKMRVIATSVEGTARKMEELGKSSDQIGRIAGVIDDIADQTNLLALNAAIEAARAGEQGRGFAVVADEVRKLAERTTTATKEIAQMIKNIQDETKTAVTAMEAGTKQVEEGVRSTTLAGDSLKQIIHMSEQVGEMITHIATAATEQSSASEEINNNMEQISKLVKESTDGAQQSAKACSDLSGLALDLQKMVSNFKLARAGGRGRKSMKSLKPASYDEPQKAYAAGAGSY